MRSTSSQPDAVEHYAGAAYLPREWDALCGENFALRRGFLRFMESANPCRQQYYGFRDAGGRLDSIVMTLEQPRLDLGMFTPISCRVPVTIVYVPLSASTPGMARGEATRDAVGRFLAGLHGFVLVLNLPEDDRLPGFARALTCPRVRLRLRWPSFDAYLADLRGNYRRRYRIAMRKAVPLDFRRIAPADFTPHHYALYEQVFNKSRIQVEKLSLDYFRGCNAAILVYELNREPAGFVQLIDNGAELVFGFVGIDYALNETYDIYHNLLLKMVDYGIRGGFASIDLGQTADDTKLKLGGEYEFLYAYMRHSHPLVNWALRRILPHIGYHPIRHVFHVFKSSTAEHELEGTHEHPARSTQTA